MKENLLKDSPEYENYSDNYKVECPCKNKTNCSKSKITLVKENK